MEVLQELGTQIFWQSVVAALFLGIFLLLVQALVRWRRAQKLYSPLTEDLLRVPGQSLQSQLSDLNEKLMIGVIWILLLPFAALIGQFGFFGWAIVLVITLTGLVYTHRVISQAMKLRLGADGEEYTGQELNQLMRSGAWVFHDIPYQYGNIDHIIVSTGGVFAVETKTFRKPEGDRQSQRRAKVRFNGLSLEFPHFESSEPVEQARRHAKYLRRCIKKNTGLDVSVIPAVALPGWYIERTARSNTWVINPKRGGALDQEVRKSVLSQAETERIAAYVESVARSVPAVSKKMDPDASRYYDFWNNRRFEEQRLK